MAEISIVVPVYKVENYINECVDSLLSQTFDDIEIVLVDDGSPDNCGNICDTYAQKDLRIRVIHKKNAGLSAARNSGLDIASGKYICFVDSDDYVSADYCETLYNLMHNTNYDYSACGIVRFNDGDTPTRDNREEIAVYSNYEYLGKQINRQREFGVWNKMYRRELFDKVRFADGKLHEDVIFSGDIARQCNNGVVETSKQCLFYRQRSESIVSKSKDKCNPDLVWAGEHLVEITAEDCPDLYMDSLWYALRYTWTFVDKVYIARSFKENNELMNSIQKLIRDHRENYRNHSRFDRLTRKRIMLFSKSRFLYGFNAYARLARVYFYRLIKKDAYKSGHGI